MFFNRRSVANVQNKATSDTFKINDGAMCRRNKGIYMTKLRIVLLVASSLYIALTASMAMATTKGLNQIVTPDIQTDGVLSVSYQQTDPNIADREQIQLEYGFNKRFEAALFQGFSPDDEVLSVEYGIIQHKDFLLSTGFANWSTQGVAAQPYLEAGYIKGNSYVMAGITEQVVSPAGNSGAVHQAQSILGYAYRLHPRLLLQVDYQAGETNYSSAGFTFNITPSLQFNPAVYLSNSVPYKGYGYAVLTWNITVHE
jgi:hypothetical protein